MGDARGEFKQHIATVGIASKRRNLERDKCHLLEQFVRGERKSGRVLKASIERPPRSPNENNFA